MNEQFLCSIWWLRGLPLRGAEGLLIILSDKRKVQRRLFLWFSVILFQSTKTTFRVILCHPLSNYKDDFPVILCNLFQSTKTTFPVILCHPLSLTDNLSLANIVHPNATLCTACSSMHLSTGKKTMHFPVVHELSCTQLVQFVFQCPNAVSTVRVRFGKYEATQAWEFGSLFFIQSNCAGILEQSMGARNRVGIGLSYRPARPHRMAGIDYLESSLGLLKSWKIRAL